MRYKIKKYSNTFKTCFSIFKIKTAEGFQYRLAGLSGATVSIFWALIEITVYTIFYHYAENKSAGILAGLTLKQVVSYVWLAQLFFLMQPMNIDDEILTKITNGDVGIEMCRPFNLYSHWFAKNAAGRISPLFWRGSILLLAGMLMPVSYRLSPPISFISMIYMLFSAFSAFLLCTAYAAFVCTIRMSVDWGNGPTYIIMLIGGVLSGSYLPLQLWPDVLQKFLLYQPFAGYLDIPVRLYLGTLPPGKAIGAICLQLIWTAVFIVLGKRIMSVRLKKIIVQGG